MNTRNFGVRTTVDERYCRQNEWLKEMKTPKGKRDFKRIYSKLRRRIGAQRVKYELDVLND